MAIVKCPECNKDISDKSENCIHCGYPLKQFIHITASNTGMNVCTSCGKFLIGVSVCPSCGGKMIDCNCSEEDYCDMLLNGTSTRWEHQMREKYVVNNESFNQELYNKNIAEEKAEDDYYQELEKRCSNTPTIFCPYCQSTNTKKISLLSRAHSIEFWWLGSAKVGKQFQCKNCGAYF